MLPTIFSTTDTDKLEQEISFGSGTYEAVEARIDSVIDPQNRKSYRRRLQKFYIVAE